MATATATATKEPWQMTKDEWGGYYTEEFQLLLKEKTNAVNEIHDLSFESANYKRITRAQNRLSRILSRIEQISNPNYLKRTHKQIISQALKEDKPVPAEVLKDYPELGKREEPKQYHCRNCGGELIHHPTGWGHKIATGCVNPAVNMKDWKRYLQEKASAKPEPEPKAESKGKEAPKPPVGEVLEGYRDIDEAKEDVKLLRRTGTRRYTVKGAEIDANTLEQAIKAKEIGVLRPKPSGAAKQSDRAIAIDRSLLAKQVVQVDDARWLKRPNRFDVRGV